MDTILTTGHWIYIGLLTVAAILIITKQHFLRPVVLLASLVVVGFLQMACASPSGALQNIFYNWGDWKRVIPFLVTVLIVLIPTFFMGKFFCGWVCHKGAVQEFLFQKKFSITLPQRLDKILRFGKYLVLFIVIAVPLMFHYRILNSSTQPFKVIFNLGGPLSAVIFIGLTAIASLFIYRPFCRYLCPVGALLGLASKVGIHKFKINESSCSACGRCEKNCDIGALSTNTVKGKKSQPKLDHSECIMCGDCCDVCSKKSIS